MKITSLLLNGFFPLKGFWCISCNKEVQQLIWGSSFLPNLLTILSGFIVLAIIVAVLAWLSAKRHSALKRLSPGVLVLNPVPLTTAAMVLGIGLGGFIDGIVLHQILQWHEMLTGRLAPNTVVAKSVNMFWDGIFHAFTFAVVFVGILLLWRVGRKSETDKSASLLWGGLLAGWGLFNIVEGIINHHLLHLHNVREVPVPELYNYSFLAISLTMLIVAYIIVRSRHRLRIG